MKSYLDKTFVISSSQARIRQDDDLLSFVMEGGAPKLIPKGTEIRVTEARILKDIIFVKADQWGWTAATNLEHGFLNETLATFPPQNDDPKGDNAAWDAGKYLKQLTLIQIVGADHALKMISSEIAEFYLALVGAAAADGVLLPLKSGFRTYAKQAALYDGFIHKRPGFNLAAKPGFSNHEDGYAYDFAISGYEGNSLYDWLKAHAPKYGFVRTVNKEPWHWEYRPEVAATGVYKTANVGK